MISSPFEFDQVVLFDHLGQAVKNQNVMFSNREIDLSNLSQGIYTIQLKNTTSGSEYSERIVLHD
ncbi:MAG: T9SS type A sorting domain-containing protein [Saprospiraceae bacterium]|nr:T9SS type A sorting domain-containing protein [Saprospiraceae bacterium]